MTGFDILNLVIGLIFIYLIFSIASSTLWEIIISLSNLKSRMLKNWILEHFNELNIIEEKKNKGIIGKFLKRKKTKNEILEHPLVKGLSVNPDKKPIYISAEIFNEVIIDCIYKPEDSTKDFDIKEFKKCLGNSKLNAGLKSVFLRYVKETDNDIQTLKEKIGNWFDETQERLVGSYKRKLQIWIFVIATILVIPTNADTIKLASYLYNNSEIRNAIANQVDLVLSDTTFIKTNLTQIDTSLYDSIINIEHKDLIRHIDEKITHLEKMDQTLTSVGIPLGWANESIKSMNLGDFTKKLIGLLLTILAVSLGAPFWFEVLNKLVNLRSSGNKPKNMVPDEYFIETQKTTTKCNKPNI